MVTVPEYGVDFWAIGAMILGIALDLTLGGFWWMPGPGPIIGRLVNRAEPGLRVAVVRRGGDSKAEALAGIVLALVVVGLVSGLAWFGSELLAHADLPVRMIGLTALVAWGLSIGRLGGEAIRASEADDLTIARRLASEFAGLGASRLDRSGLARFLVEGIGERANRMVIAPLFWLAIGGPAGLWGYQAVETLGRLVVDRGPRSQAFGLASARLIILVNYIPARLTWLLLGLSAALLGEDAGSAFRTGRTQGRSQPDRPGTWGIATLDGALGIEPGGRSATDPVDSATVRRAIRIVRVAFVHAVALVLAFRILVIRG